MSRLLKAKYFKNSNLLDCHLGSRPSFIWKSLWNVMVKIKEWIVWEERDQQWIWIGDHNKVFSAKSVYESLRDKCFNKEKDLTGQQACNKKNQIFWRTIWRSPLQPNVKFFCWRLYHNYIPTTVNLNKRGMTVQPHCPVCNHKNETSSHVILYCWWADCFWKNLGINCSFLQHNFNNIGDWMWFCVFNSSKKDLMLIFRGARAIWFKRNELINGGELSDPIKTARELKFLDNQDSAKERKISVTELYEGWNWYAPPVGTVKINTDGAWDSDTHIAGIGICGRNHSGNVCFSITDWYPDVSSSIDAEILALHRGMLIAVSRNLVNVIFEIDSAEVMKLMLQGPKFTRGQHGLIEWCRQTLMQKKYWNMNLVLREANASADYLAKRAKSEKWKCDNCDLL